MSEVIKKSKSKKDRSAKFDKLIGPTDPKIDFDARERLVRSRIALLLNHSFFGNLATRLKLINADDWCSTAATDGLNFYYNSRFIMMLKPKEVDFLVGHEVLHVVYDHIGRREHRDPQLWNIANDYAVNSDLKKQKIGTFITTVPCLYDHKFDNKSSEEIYDILMENAEVISIDDLIESLLDEHIKAGEGTEDSSEGENKKGKRPQISNEEHERIRQELKQVIISAAQTAEAGSIPNGVNRLIKNYTNPVMPWRELIQSNLTSMVRNDYSWMRTSRRGWDMDAVMPGMTPGEEIDVTIAIDMSGSITDEQAKKFLGEISGIMNSFDGYQIKVLSFDTEVYNVQKFTSDNLDTIDEYEPQGGGGTDFNCVFEYMKNEGEDTKRLIMFTDGYPYGSWGDENYCDTTFIIHGNDSIVPPFGSYAYLKE